MKYVHIAQLDRVFPSEGKGRGFNSHYEHHFVIRYQFFYKFMGVSNEQGIRKSTIYCR